MMEWGELALAVLLITALVAQFVRVWKQGGFEPREEEADRGVNTLLQESTRIPVREPGGPTEQPGLAQPATDAFTTRRPRTSHIDVNTRSMRRGIILMTILEPCRGVNPFVFRD
jgi:hypothetical protein